MPTQTFVSQLTLRAGPGLLAVAGALACALPAFAGFVSGDLYVVSASLPNPSAPPQSIQGIMRVQPIGGATSWVGSFASLSPQFATHDPFRDRLACPAATALVFIDELGATQTSATAPPAFGSGAGPIAPAGDGRVYMAGTNKPVVFLDAAGVWHTLFDVDGVTPFMTNSAQFLQAAIFDASAQALLLFSRGVGSDVGKTVIQRLALSANGTKLAAPPTSVVGDLVASSEDIGGVTAGPNGTVMISVDDNSNSLQPRFWLLDPTTLALSIYTTNEHAFVAAQTSGGWCGALGEAVALNTGLDQIIAYNAPAGGAGSVVASGVSSPGGSAELARLVVIGGMVIGSAAVFGDLNGDGVVDGADLGILLGSWGACAGCPADLNGDGVVDGGDLGLLLGSWTI